MGHRRSSRLLRLLVGVLAVASAGGARAQRSVDAELFHAALDSYGLFTVERAETARQWGYGFQLSLDYAANPLRLQMFDAEAMAPRSAVILERQIALGLGAHLGLTDWLELAFELPMSAESYGAAYGQAGSSQDATLMRTGFYAAGPYTNIGPPDASPLDARVALKSRLFRRSLVGLAVAAVATLPFGNSTAFLGDNGPTFRPVLIADVTRGRFTAAINLGAIIRAETIVVDPHDVQAGVARPRVLIDVGDELTWSAGAAYRFARWGGLAAEAYGLLPVQHAPSQPGDAGRDFTADVLGGLQVFPGRDLILSVGGGGGVITQALRRDEFRGFLAIRWAPNGGGGAASPGSIDTDGDGIRDEQDLCPDQAEDRDGFQDDDGCPDPDNDGDGIADAKDRCPNDPEDRDGFQDDDGCPDPDNDGDGIADAQDRCPNDPEDRDGFQDDDGCPDPDNDGDGIADANDRCPNDPETRNGIDDEDGCPDSGGAPVAREPLRLGEPLQFDSGQVALSTRMKAQLDHLADRILAHPEATRIRIEGHADDVGSVRSNLEVSQARADAVRAYLIGRGIDAARLQAVGYGGKRPIDRRHTSLARARNRRVDFIVVEPIR